MGSPSLPRLLAPPTPVPHLFSEPVIGTAARACPLRAVDGVNRPPGSAGEKAPQQIWRRGQPVPVPPYYFPSSFCLLPPSSPHLYLYCTPSRSRALGARNARLGAQFTVRCSHHRAAERPRN